MTKRKPNYFGALTVSLISGLLVLSCLNPIGFNPELKLDVNLSGEISIDSVNSAEIQIRNHTKSIDIYKTNIVYRETDSSSGVTSESTAARITGAPTAGTQESILLRPITSDPNTKYRLEIWYRQAATCPSDLNQSNHPAWSWGAASSSSTPDKMLELVELPRGKYVVHVYRKSNGDIGISVEDDMSSMTEMNDNHYDQDFMVNVKVNNMIDLSGAEINLTMPGSGLNVNTSVSFSSEVTALFNSLIEAINANRPYPNGYGMVIVRNHTSQQLSNIEFTKGGSTVGLPGVIRAEDQNGMILSKGTWEAKLNVSGYAGNPVGPKNILMANGGKEYLHVYKNKSGGFSFVVSEKEWTGDLILSLSDADSSYSFTVNININTPNTNPNKGALFIHNMTTKLLDAPDPGKMHIVSQDLSPAATYDLAIGAKATIGGLVDPSNYDVSVGTKSTTVFVSHMQPTHVYYYRTRNGNYNISDYWPPYDADQSDGIDLDLGTDQAIIVIKNRSDYIIDMFSWMAHEYEIELTSGDDVATVVEAGTSPIGFMVRGGSYGEYVTRTVNPGQTLTITVQGNQIIDITPPVVITPPPPPPIIPPVTYDQTIVFKHETGYDTPIEYLILYRDNGVAWNNSAKNTGYVGVGSGIYYLYTRTLGSNAIAADSGSLAKGLPNRPSNYGPTKQQWVASPIPGLDNSATTSVLEAVTNRTAPELTGKISVGSLPGVGDYAVKIQGTVVSNWYGTPYGKNHPLVEINDSVIIQFDPPLQRHETYKFKLNRGTQDAPINWFVSWIGAHHNGSPTSNNVRYNAGYFGDCWFILCPWWHDRSTLNITAKGVALRYE